MMLTFQIKDTLLSDYIKDKLTKERLEFLTSQVEQQIEEISQNEEVYTQFLNEINPPKEVDKIILWILLMSNEDIVEEYIDSFNKDFREIIPVSDLADLLLYLVYLEKVKKTPLEGTKYLLTYKEDGIEEMDQYAFTNALLYIQKSKEIAIEF